jgi:haloalkane dehalogenase
LSWRFKLFLSGRNLPGFGATLAWLSGRQRLRRNQFVLGGAFLDKGLLDGEFDEFFLAPLRDRPERLDAAIRLLRSFHTSMVADLGAIHRRLDVPVRLVWGDQDPFFPLAWAEEMVGTFPDADLEVVRGAALFSHEERPAEVAAALLPVLTGTR